MEGLTWFVGCLTFGRSIHQRHLTPEYNVATHRPFFPAIDNLILLKNAYLTHLEHLHHCNILQLF